MLSGSCGECADDTNEAVCLAVGTQIARKQEVDGGPAGPPVCVMSRYRDLGVCLCCSGTRLPLWRPSLLKSFVGICKPFVCVCMP